MSTQPTPAATGEQRERLVERLKFRLDEANVRHQEFGPEPGSGSLRRDLTDAIAQLASDGADAAYIAELERRIYNYDEGSCDHACGICVKNAGADDSLVKPGFVCTYHKVMAKRDAAATPDKQGGT